MLLKIKINVMVGLWKKVFIWGHESLLFGKKNNATFIIDYAWKKYFNVFILQKYFIEWHNGLLRPRMSFKG